MHINRRAVAPHTLSHHALRLESRSASLRSPLRQRRLNSSSTKPELPKSEVHKPDTASPESSRSPTPSFSPTRAPVSIPGPAWLWIPLKPLAVPLSFYNRAQSKRPYVTQFVSSLVIYFLGDLSSQFIQRPARSPDAGPSEEPNTPASKLSHDAAQASTTASPFQHYDPSRSLRAICIGGISSIPSYTWFMYLSSLFTTYTHLPRLALQVAINQVVFAPLFNTYFFGMQSLLASVFDSSARDQQIESGGRLRAAGRRVADTVPISWYNSCKFWPLVTAFSFTFVQPRSRSVFAGVVAVGWQTYLGLLNQRAVEAEVEEGRVRAESGLDALRVSLQGP